jgi:hypothetical protein
MIDDVTANGIIARVAAGAQFLDENFPGWERVIDLSILDISSPYACIIWQVGKEFIENVRTMSYTQICIDNDIEGGEYGFDIPISLHREILHLESREERSAASNEVWSFLGELWIGVIKERFNSGFLSDGDI